MPAPTLKALLSSRSGGATVFTAIREHLAPGICIFDASGRVLIGDASTDLSLAQERIAIVHDSATLGYVVGSSAQASAIALLLKHLADRDSENRALASEVLHLYREVHLIEELSEQLAPLLNVEAVAHSALEQAQKMICATHGSIMVLERADSPLSTAASFCDLRGADSIEFRSLGPESVFAKSILERGLGEIINDCLSDSRVQDADCGIKALI